LALTGHTACYLEPQRRGKRADDVIGSFALGCRGKIVRNGRLDEAAADHALIGTWHVAQTLIPEIHARGQSYWHLDSCYIHSPERHYRLTRNSEHPKPRVDLTLERALALGVELKPWRTDGEHVLICRQGPSSGRHLKINPNGWNDIALGRLSKLTKRPIMVREKVARESRPLAEDLQNCWCVVTHSSTAAVEAAIAGIPVICTSWGAAWPIATDALDRIEAPPMPERRAWLATLAWSQWTMEELASGAWLPTSGLQ
jgi:hypothetical protein